MVLPVNGSIAGGIPRVSPRRGFAAVSVAATAAGETCSAPSDDSTATDTPTDGHGGTPPAIAASTITDACGDGNAPTNRSAGDRHSRSIGRPAALGTRPHGDPKSTDPASVVPIQRDAAAFDDGITPTYARHNSRGAGPWT